MPGESQTRKTHPSEAVLRVAAEQAHKYLREISERRVAPSGESAAALSNFNEPFPEQASDPSSVVEMLHKFGAPATVATTGGRYFGFVIGGTLPAALGASWLANTWDQNAAYRVMSPIAAELEDVVLEWLRGLFGLPAECGGGLTTCATTANFSALAAARYALLAKQGWNVEEDGMFGAPPIEVIVGEDVHASVLKALGMAGYGRKRVTIVEADEQGRMRADRLPRLTGNSLVCIQAGNVNTGAYDPATEICRRARDAGAWVHVDGAFGLWAAASPKYAHLLQGVNLADSWATDVHKWPNINYDSGIVFVRDAAALRAPMSVTAAYLQPGTRREPTHHTPEASRRARGIELWAGLRSLGKSGLANLIEQTCGHARRFAEGLRHAGYEILNEVVINQVLVSFGSAEKTQGVMRRIQEDGTCWCGGTVWKGRTAMRISVSSWATTQEDVEKSLAAMIRIAREVAG